MDFSGKTALIVGASSGIGKETAIMFARAGASVVLAARREELLEEITSTDSYAINGQIHVPKKAALLMTYANTAKKQAGPIDSHYDTLIDYLGWSDAGRVIAPGVWTENAVRSTEYPQKAYSLGKNL